MKPGPTRWLGVALLLGLAAPALAHLNSPHVYRKARLGGYDALLVVNLPPAVPGEAEVQVLVSDAPERPGPWTVRVRGIPPQGEETAADWIDARPSEVDDGYFTAPIPLMVRGLWRAEVELSGPDGSGVASLPFSARIPKPRTLEGSVRNSLIGLASFLLISITTIMSSMGRLAHRSPEAPVTPADRRRGRIWGTISAVLFVGYLLWVASFWADYDRSHRIASLPKLDGELVPLNPPVLAGKRLELAWRITIRERPLSAVVPDAGKDMSLHVVAWPDASYLQLTYPRLEANGVMRFALELPHPGRYKLFGDVVLRSGDSQTVTSDLVVGEGRASARPSFDDPDSSELTQPPLGALLETREVDVGGGYSLRRRGEPSAVLLPRRPAQLEFELLGSDGEPVEELDVHLGMSGHMIVLRDDALSFAHVFPSGTLGSALTDGSQSPARELKGGRVGFPYGFPEAGLYRLWVQLKHAGRLHTGAFDVRVAEEP